MFATVKKEHQRTVQFLTDCVDLTRTPTSTTRAALSPVNDTYNHVSRFMDCADSMIESYRFRHRHQHWTHAALWGAVQLVLHDAFIMAHSHDQDSRRAHEEFLVSVVTDLRDQGLELLGKSASMQEGTTSVSADQNVCTTRTAEIDPFHPTHGACVACKAPKQRHRCSQCHQYFCKKCLQQHWGFEEE